MVNPQTGQANATTSKIVEPRGEWNGCALVRRTPQNGVKKIVRAEPDKIRLRER